MVVKTWSETTNHRDGFVIHTYGEADCVSSFTPMAVRDTALFEKQPPSPSLAALKHLEELHSQLAALQAALTTPELVVVLVISEVPLLWHGYGPQPAPEIRKIKELVKKAKANKKLKDGLDDYYANLDNEIDVRNA